MQQVVKTLPIHAVVKHITNCLHVPRINHTHTHIYIMFLKRPINALGYVNVSLLYW